MINGEGGEEKFIFCWETHTRKFVLGEKMTSAFARDILKFLK